MSKVTTKQLWKINAKNASEQEVRAEIERLREEGQDENIIQMLWETWESFHGDLAGNEPEDYEYNAEEEIIDLPFGTYEVISCKPFYYYDQYFRSSNRTFSYVIAPLTIKDYISGETVDIEIRWLKGYQKTIINNCIKLFGRKENTVRYTLGTYGKDLERGGWFVEKYDNNDDFEHWRMLSYNPTKIENSNSISNEKIQVRSAW